MKKGYIVLTDTGTCLTRFIRLFTKYPYNHASIAFDSRLSEVYSFGRKKVYHPFIGGFVKEAMHETLFQQASCTIYSFEATEEQWRKLSEFVEKMKEKTDDYHYNFLGLFGFLRNKPIERENAYFCSQFVATALSFSGIASFTKSPALIAPHDLATLPGLQLEFEGKLKDYQQETFNRFSYETFALESFSEGLMG